MAVRARAGAALVAVAIGAGALVAGPAGAVDPSADLSVTIDHSPGTPKTGDEVTLSLHARNDGPDVAEGTVLAVNVLYELQVVSGADGCTQSQATGALICDLGDIAAGATIDKAIVVRPSASGLYSITAAVASSTPDPDSADRTATDSLIVQKGPSQAERYLKAIYPIILDRPIDAGALAYWIPRWQQASYAYPQRQEAVPASIIASAEHRRGRVRSAYQRFFDRAPDPAGLAYWTTKLGTGTTTEAFERSLLSSPEFSRRFGGDGGPDLVRAILKAVLGTEPSSALSTTWTRFLYDGNGLVATVQGIQRSTESYDALIAVAYQDVFGRAPSALERYSWQVGLRNGETRESMLSDLLVSWPFLAQFPRTIDDYPDEYFTPVAPASPADLLAEAEAAAAA